MSGYHANDEPIELHDQQLQYLEHRFTEHVKEQEKYSYPRRAELPPFPPRVLPVLALNEVFIGESLSSRYVKQNLFVHNCSFLFIQYPLLSMLLCYQIYYIVIAEFIILIYFLAV